MGAARISRRVSAGNRTLTKRKKEKGLSQKGNKFSNLRGDKMLQWMALEVYVLAVFPGSVFSCCASLNVQNLIARFPTAGMSTTSAVLPRGQSRPYYIADNFTDG